MHAFTVDPLLELSTSQVWQGGPGLLALGHAAHVIEMELLRS